MTISRLQVLVIALALLAAVVTAGACADPEATVRTSNQSYDLARLFESPEGCHVYRFFDRGSYRYFVVCPQLPRAAAEGVTLEGGKVKSEHATTAPVVTP